MRKQHQPVTPSSKVAFRKSFSLCLFVAPPLGPTVMGSTDHTSRLILPVKRKMVFMMCLYAVIIFQWISFICIMLLV
jgi:hypothetical protein